MKNLRDLEKYFWLRLTEEFTNLGFSRTTKDLFDLRISKAASLRVFISTSTSKGDLTFEEYTGIVHDEIQQLIGPIRDEVFGGSSSRRGSTFMINIGYLSPTNEFWRWSAQCKDSIETGLSLALRLFEEHGRAYCESLESIHSVRQVIDTDSSRAKFVNWFAIPIIYALDGSPSKGAAFIKQEYLGEEKPLTYQRYGEKLLTLNCLSMR